MKRLSKLNQIMSMMLAIVFFLSVAVVGVQASEINVKQQGIEVDLKMLHESSDKDSSADACLDGPGVVKEVNGVLRLYITLKPTVTMNMNGYLNDLFYYKNTSDYENNIRTYMDVESVNNVGYPCVVSFELPKSPSTIYIGFKIAIPSMPTFNMEHVARLVGDYTKVGIEVDLKMLHESSDKDSSADACLDGPGVVKEVDGVLRLYITLKPTVTMNMNGYLNDLFYYKNSEDYKNDVRTNMDIESVNSEGYPSVVSFELPESPSTIYIGFKIAIPSMPTFSMEHIARLVGDYSEVGDFKEDGDITNPDLGSGDNADGSQKVELKNGVYSIPVSFLMVDKDEVSKANATLEPKGILEVKDDVAKVYLTLKEMNFAGMNSSISKMWYYTNYETGDKSEVTVEKMDDNSLPKVVSFEVPLDKNCIYVSTEVNLGHDSAIDMRLKLDYDNISEYSDEKTYEDGTYKVNVKFLNASKDEASMANDALEEIAKIVIKNGVAKIYISTKPITMGTITASLQTLEYENLDGTYSYADITSRSSDGNPTGFTFTLPSYEETLNIKVNPMVTFMGNQPIAARLNVDYSTIEKVSDDFQLPTVNQVVKGETLGNDEVVTNNTNKVVGNTTAASQKTGDYTNVMAVAIITLVSFSTVVFMIKRKKGVA